MRSPTVSVVLPVYNGEDYLRIAIDSVLAQTLKDLELIVVDDGSTDSTGDIARSYGGHLKYVRKENGGVATAFNRGIRESAGRYISWLSHDDVFEPGKLEMQVRALSGYETPAVCYTDIRFINAQGAVMQERELDEHERGDLLRHLLVGASVSLAAYSLLFDRRCVEEVGMYDESRPYTQDAEMLLRLATRFPFVRVPQHLIRIRQHEGRASLNQGWVSEAFRFYQEWLDKLSLEELFPELGDEATGLERARAREWLGDRYADLPGQPYPKLSEIQYLKALRESPAILPSVAPKIAHLWSRRFRDRNFYRIGFRTAIVRRLRPS